jgi:hypothetical protein
VVEVETEEIEGQDRMIHTEERNNAHQTLSRKVETVVKSRHCFMQSSRGEQSAEIKCPTMDACTFGPNDHGSIFNMA